MEPVSSAAKRALLEAAGEPWPACACHGVPELWRAQHRHNGGYYTCAVRNREQQNRRRANRQSAGGCVHCGGPLETETMCGGCAETHREASWRHDHTPQRQHRKQILNVRQRNRRRAEGDYRPTGVGRAAFAAWTKTGGN